MKRREFMALIAASAAAVPSIAVAQTSRMQRVGILMLGNPDPALFLQEFGDQLRELGYSDGKNVALELRNANGSSDRLAPLARELGWLYVVAVLGLCAEWLLRRKLGMR